MLRRSRGTSESKKAAPRDGLFVEFSKRMDRMLDSEPAAHCQQHRDHLRMYETSEPDAVVATVCRLVGLELEECDHLAAPYLNDARPLE